MKKQFVFFGCSWTYGKYINLVPEKEYDLSEHNYVAEEKQLAETHSYRALISKYFDADCVNFSRRGSSNDRQFRYASEYFIGPTRVNPFYRIDTPFDGIPWPTKKESNSKIYVLWFITSTARKEWFYTATKEYKNESLVSTDNSFAKEFCADYYDHDYELERMAHQMTLWNHWFQLHGIKNLWIDTFNHHDYNIDIDNCLKFNSPYSDIMSNLCIQQGCNQVPKETHMSLTSSDPDDSRSQYLRDKQLLNDQTLHPNIKGHQAIADMLIPLIQNQFSL